jgi:hypothetical protein
METVNAKKRWKTMACQFLKKSHKVTGLDNKRASFFKINNIIIIIINPPQSTAGHRPLQLLTISLDLRLLASSSIFGYSHQAPSSLALPGLRASYTKFTETWSPL